MSGDRAPLDLTTPTSVHVIGVGGAGMSAIALVLAQMGHRVTGSDLRPSGVIEQLRRAGVEVSIGHEAANLGDAAWVTASPAVPTTNPELVAARELHRPVLTRAAVMGAITRLKSTLAVAGTHGKTTTSSMLSLIALEAGLAPSYLIGAELSGVGMNAHWGEGSLLIVEADESYGSFGEIAPFMVGITNVEVDHLDHYGTFDQLEDAFSSLIDRSSHRSVVIADDPGAARLGARHGAIRVGTGSGMDVTITDVALNRASSSFTLGLPHGGAVSVKVGAPGLHNVRNAALAAVMADQAGMGAGDVAAGLARFAGVPRRFEFRGQAGGVTFVDDYAHLPAEVSATLQAALAGGFDRIVAVFQPHRYTRTQAVAASFADAFAGADVVVVTDIYAAGETPIPGVSGRLVADAVAARLPEGTVHYVADDTALASLVNELLRPGDLCLTMGAGNLTDLPDLLVDRRR